MSLFGFHRMDRMNRMGKGGPGVAPGVKLEHPGEVGQVALEAGQGVIPTPLHHQSRGAAQRRRTKHQTKIALSPYCLTRRHATNPNNSNIIHAIPVPPAPVSQLHPVSEGPGGMTEEPPASALIT